MEEALDSSRRERKNGFGLNITDEQIAELKAHADDINYDVAEAQEKKFATTLCRTFTLTAFSAPKGGRIHLGATSCYVGDNTDVITITQGLEADQKKACQFDSKALSFADEYKSMPCLAFTHFQPAQPTTVGKRATLWAQDVLMDLMALEFQLSQMKLLGSKGTTGTQASFVDLFDGDDEKIKALDKKIAEKMGFSSCFSVSGQTYSRKLDSQVLFVLSGIAQSASKFSQTV